MANWYGAGRTNHVRIADIEGLREALEPWGNGFRVVSRTHGDGIERTVILADTEDGGFPCWTTQETENGSEDLEFDWSERVVPFLAEGEVLICVEAGHEKLRYISGHAQAFAWDGRITSISLSDIVQKARKEFGLPPGQITEPVY